MLVIKWLTELLGGKFCRLGTLQRAHSRPLAQCVRCHIETEHKCRKVRIMLLILLQLLVFASCAPPRCDPKFRGKLSALFAITNFMLMCASGPAAQKLDRTSRAGCGLFLIQKLIFVQLDLWKILVYNSKKNLKLQDEWAELDGDRSKVWQMVLMF